MTKPKIVFAPGCFDNLDVSQEELDKLMADLQQMVEDGTLFENSRLLDENDPEDLEIMKKIDSEMIENANRKLQ
jgi:glycosyltransferase A (GT-A) superfamily protein (DUF2064 family)